MAKDLWVDFYPTPEKLINRLTEDIDWRAAGWFLDPGAGKGAICDYVREKVKYSSYSGNREADIDVIEINPELQHVLRGKDYRLIHDDFLTFRTRKAYNYILGNFPFSEGDKHLERALALLDQHGGKLRCLVNAETIKNPHTNLRRALVTKLEELGAEIEYIAGAFKNAERPTDVEVAMIRADAKPPKRISMIWQSLHKAQAAAPGEFEPGELVGGDFISAICALFDKECEAGVQLIEEYYAMKPYIQNRLVRPDDSDTFSSAMITLCVDDRRYSDGPVADVNDYLRKVRKKYWEALIRDERFSNQYTSNILNELERKLEELKEYDFTPFNIRELQKELAPKIVEGVEKAILDLFGLCSRTHAYGEDFGSNIHYYNGWKTNKAHRVNKKIILPMYGLNSDWGGGSRIEYRFGDKLSDMVKVFNYLARDKADDVPKLVGAACADAQKYQDFKLDVRYFHIKLFKKGTAHIWFKDLELLEKFNIFGSQKKGWLPPAYGKKRYSEMSKEERQVVDEFQGKEKYDRVMRERDFFIVDTNALRLTPGLLLTAGVGTLPESIGDDGLIAVDEPIEPDPQEPSEYGPIPPLQLEPDRRTWDELGEEAKRRGYQHAIETGQVINETYEDFAKYTGSSIDWREDGTPYDKCEYDPPPPFSLTAAAFPKAPPAAQSLPLELHTQPAEPEEKIAKEEWFCHYKNGTGYVKKGVRYIVKQGRRVPVSVEGMAAPRGK